MVELQYPVRNFSWRSRINQFFGVSRDVYSPAFNIPGHNGIDISGQYGEDILAAHDGTVVEVSFDNTRSKGSGVYLQITLPDGNVLQTIYWHMSKVLVTQGQQVTVGQKIGEIGNTGFVNPPPTAICPHCGTHLHFAVALFSNGQPVFTDYVRFVDPVPYLFAPGDKLPLHLDRDLFFGLSGDDVSYLQTMLKLEGLANDYVPIGYFGGKTARDVMAVQKQNGITPLLGYVGPKTRKYLNGKYTIIG